jgi:hypothetical protein
LTHIAIIRFATEYEENGFDYEVSADVVETDGRVINTSIALGRERRVSESGPADFTGMGGSGGGGGGGSRRKRRTPSYLENEGDEDDEDWAEGNSHTSGREKKAVPSTSVVPKAIAARV